MKEAEAASAALATAAERVREGFNMVGTQGQSLYVA